MFRRQILRHGLKFLDRQETYLPVKPATLQERMLQDSRLSNRERAMLARLFERIAARFHMEFRQRLEYLKSVYDPFDPDVDTVAAKPQAEASTNAENLARSFAELLHDANYAEMPREQIVACAEYQARRDIVVHASLSDYAELRVFYRGIHRVERQIRPWYTPWRTRRITQHVLSRVTLFVRLAKQSEVVFLKLFKNVVAEDLEMLLPYVRIHMKLFDQLKIGSSVIGGLATASWKAWSAAAISPWVALVVGSGFTGACVKGVMGFFSSKARYIHTLTANLYFQNLANNGSLLAHVLDAAEAEQCKELLLAYFLLYIERAHNLTQERLDRRAEDWLANEFQVNVDFDIHEAVQKLVDKRLVVRQESVNSAVETTFPVLKVYDLPSSLRRLDESWDDCFEDELTVSSGGDRLADAHWPPFEASPVTRRMDDDQVKQTAIGSHKP